MNEAGDAYTIKSAKNEQCIVNITVKRRSPGFQIGKDGTTTFGTDPAHPWGTMRHAFLAALHSDRDHADTHQDVQDGRHGNL